MPATRSSLKRPRPVEVTFEAEGETLTIVFDRNRITQAWAKRIAQGIAADDIDAAVNGTLEVLQSWDVVEDDGSPTPLTAEILSDLPLGVMKALTDAIADASAPSSEEGNASSDISSPPLTDSSSRPETHQNSPLPSPSPPPSVSPLQT